MTNIEEICKNIYLVVELYCIHHMGVGVPGACNVNNTLTLSIIFMKIKK